MLAHFLGFNMTLYVTSQSLRETGSLQRSSKVPLAYIPESAL